MKLAAALSATIPSSALRAMGSTADEHIAQVYLPRNSPFVPCQLRSLLASFATPTSPVTALVAKWLQTLLCLASFKVLAWMELSIQDVSFAIEHQTTAGWVRPSRGFGRTSIVTSPWLGICLKIDSVGVVAGKVQEKALAAEKVAGIKVRWKLQIEVFSF